MLQTVRINAARITAIALPIVLSIGAAPAHAEYPEKPIQLIVPFGPGGPADILARVVSARLSERLRKQVVIENQSGASTIVGTQHAAQSRPDGYTLVVFSLTHAANAASDRPLPYDSLKDFTPVAMLGASPFMLVVNPQDAWDARRPAGQGTDRRAPRDARAAILTLTEIIVKMSIEIGPRPSYLTVGASRNGQELPPAGLEFSADRRECLPSRSTSEGIIP